MEFINLTPHKCCVKGIDGNSRVIEPSGSVARVQSTMEKVEVIDGIQVYDTRFGDVENLTAAEDGKIFIVSRIVKGRCPERTDVLVPGNALRDEAGNIIGSDGLCR